MGTKPLPVLWAFSHSKQEINDSNGPFGSDSCLNGIPPSAAKGGELGQGCGSFRPLHSGSWMELDEGLHGTVCFTKGKPLLIRPLKISSQQEQRILHFTSKHKKSALSEMFPEQRKPCASSRMGSAFPGVCCPVQRMGGSSAGSQHPAQRAAWPCTLREGCLGGLGSSGLLKGVARWADNAHKPITCGWGRATWL